MYYSYKSKKRRSEKYKYLLIISAIALSFYLGYKYKNYIFFWQYTYNKLCETRDQISAIDKKEIQIKRLTELKNICGNYNKDNPTSAKAFLLTANIHFQLGELLNEGVFSELFIYCRLNNINEKAKNEFINAVKYYKKAIALSKGMGINNQDLLRLIMACYYAGHSDIRKFREKLNTIEITAVHDNADLLKFYSLAMILTGSENEGIEILKTYNGSDSISGQLFMANALRIAQKHTSSILEFKKILDKTEDSRVIKLVNISLGEIYFNQSLYNESLTHFTDAFNIDKMDNQLKIWIGKNYSALGQKTKARAIWSEVLASDRNNDEARKLLGLM